jgi:YD repeat-containing protein
MSKLTGKVRARLASAVADLFRDVSTPSRLATMCGRTIGASFRIEQLEDRTLFGYGYNNAPDVPPITSPGPQSCPATTGPNDPSANDGTNSGPPLTSDNPVNYFTGKPTVTTTDLQSDGFGRSWGVTRTWEALNDTGQAGNGWLNTTLPYLVAQRNQYAPSHAAVITVIDDANTQKVFVGDLYDTGMQPTYDLQDQLTYVPPTSTTSGGVTTYIPGEFLLTDTSGNVTAFYDMPRDSTTQVTVTGSSDTVGRLYSAGYYAQETTNQWGLNGDTTTQTPGTYRFGAFKSFTDADGNVTTAVYDPGSGNLTEMDRTDAASGAQERFYYQYATVSNSLGGSDSLVSQISLQRRPNSTSS